MWSGAKNSRFGASRSNTVASVGAGSASEDATALDPLAPPVHRDGRPERHGGRDEDIDRRNRRRQPPSAIASAIARAMAANATVARPTTRAAVGWTGLSPARSGPCSSS